MFLPIPIWFPFVLLALAVALLFFYSRATAFFDTVRRNSGTTTTVLSCSLTFFIPCANSWRNRLSYINFTQSSTDFTGPLTTLLVHTLSLPWSPIFLQSRWSFSLHCFPSFDYHFRLHRSQIHYIFPLIFQLFFPFRVLFASSAMSYILSFLLILPTSMQRRSLFLDYHFGNNQLMVLEHLSLTWEILYL